MTARGGGADTTNLSALSASAQQSRAAWNDRAPRAPFARQLRVDRPSPPAIFRRLRDLSLVCDVGKSPCGGIGRRARLKIEFRKECWFDSGQGHQACKDSFPTCFASNSSGAPACLNQQSPPPNSAS